MTLVGVMESSTTAVASAACERWRLNGDEATLTRWSRLAESVGVKPDRDEVAEAILVPTAQSIECVLDAAPNWRDLRTQIEAIVESGWTVTILTPLKVMGAAHANLQGCSAALQGWWSSEDRALHFSRIETL